MVGRQVTPVEATGEEEFDESIWAEWAKMKARQDRWEEEYMLIQEEMRRTVVYLEWKAKWWKQQGTQHRVENLALSQALKAYALRQAHLWTMLAKSCVDKWIPLLKKNEADISWAAHYHNLSDETESDDEGDEKIFDRFEFDNEVDN